MPTSASITIVDFQSVHKEAFKALNIAWIKEHWEPEPDDFKSLDHPIEYIIEPGGHIAIAILTDPNGEQTVVGTCALIRTSADLFELAKMAVAPAAKGLGIGERLGIEIIQQARRRKAKRLFLDSNTVLTPAISLYRKLGFLEVPLLPSPYARANIRMEMVL